MNATAKLLGYTGKVNIIEEHNNGYEIEMLEGNLQGKRTFVSKGSKNELISFTKDNNNNKGNKFTSNVNYNTHKEYNKSTKTNQVTYRYFELTITASNKQLASDIWNNCYNYIVKNADCNIELVGCPSCDETLKGKYTYSDSLIIEDKEDYEYLKELYTEWKKEMKKI